MTQTQIERGEEGMKMPAVGIKDWSVTTLRVIQSPSRIYTVSHLVFQDI